MLENYPIVLTSSEEKNTQVDKSVDNIKQQWLLVDSLQQSCFVSNGVFKDLSLQELIQKNKRNFTSLKFQNSTLFPFNISILNSSYYPHLYVNAYELNKDAFWYILQKKHSNIIRAGLRYDKTSQQFLTYVKNHELFACIKSYPAEEDDAYILPAGRMFGADKDIKILQISQNLDDPSIICSQETDKMSYTNLDKIDFKNKGIAIIRKDASPSRRNSKVPLSHYSQCFAVDKINLLRNLFTQSNPNCVQVLVPLKQDLIIDFKNEQYLIPKFSCCIIPCNMGRYTLLGEDFNIILQVSLKG